MSASEQLGACRGYSKRRTLYAALFHSQGSCCEAARPSRRALCSWGWPPSFALRSKMLLKSWFSGGARLERRPAVASLPLRDGEMHGATLLIACSAEVRRESTLLRGSPRISLSGVSIQTFILQEASFHIPLVTFCCYGSVISAADHLPFQLRSQKSIPCSLLSLVSLMAVVLSSSKMCVTLFKDAWVHPFKALMISH